MAEPTLWQKEIDLYGKRIEALCLLTGALTDELANFPGLLSFQPTDAGSVRHRSLIFTNQMLTSASELLGSIKLLRSNARFLAAAHCIRLLFELWGALLYARHEVVQKLVDKDGPKIADARLTKLLLGTKSFPLLPAGITEEIPVINVMEFIRSTYVASSDAEVTYNFLCDASHPTFMHYTFCSLTIDGAWMNDV